MEFRDVGPDGWRVSLVGGDAATRERIAADLGGDRSDRGNNRSRIDVRIPESGSVDDALGDGAVDCVVIVGDLPDRGTVSFVETLREQDPDLPIVSYPPEGDLEDATTLTGAGVTEYLPQDRDDPERSGLTGRVRSAARDYRRRRLDRDGNEMFRALMRDLPVEIDVKDDQGRYVAASSTLAESSPDRLVGRTEAEAWGDTFSESATDAHEEDLQVVETETPVVGKDERLEIGDRVVWQRTTKVPWRTDGGEVRGVIGLTLDVTECKNHERLVRRQARQLERFASFVSHDLRNPIAVATGHLELARETGDGEHFDAVENSLERMDDLVDDLLSMARYGEEEEETVDWLDLRQAVARTAGASSLDEATIHNEIPAGTRLRASEGGLRRLLENLFRNAVEHGTDGVEVTVGLTSAGVFVADDGPGIAPEDRDRIFEYGYSTEGTGIGLAIVREVASEHGWELAVGESASGGARFDVEGAVVLPPSIANATEGDSVELSKRCDVGDATPPGRATATAPGEWTVEGGGRDLWNDLDECHLVHADVEGPVRIVARIADLEGVHEHSKAGVTVRASRDEGAPMAYAGLTAEHGTETLWRGSAGDTIRSRQFEDVDGPPYWYRIDRVGDRITWFTSPDGEEWTVLDQHAIDVDELTTVGLAVCSHDRERLCRAQFDGVRVVTLEPGGQ